ncbi:MAG: 5-formyltetrahydrofolate cyclo-ligase [Pseudomonadota bacterium]
MASLKDQKQAMRAGALAKRDALDPAFRIEVGLEVADHAGDLPSAAIVGGYWAIRSEMDPRATMQMLADRGARLALPAVLDPQTIVFRELTRHSELVPGGFGTMAPSDAAPVLEPDMLLMPLAGVDARGNRIGYGAGFYDRYIQSARLRPLLIGVAFECQRFDAIEAENHDQPLDGLLTEAGLHMFRRD